MHTIDPSLESQYAHCVIDTLMRTVPYPVQQHLVAAAKYGLPLHWWSRTSSRNATSPFHRRG